MRKGAQLGLFGGGARPAEPPAPAPARPARAARARPTGAGWLPIPGSKHGGYHRPKAGGGWEYWYPGEGELSPEQRADIEGPGGPAILRTVDKAGVVEEHRRAYATHDSRTLSVGSSDTYSKVGVGTTYTRGDGTTGRVTGIDGETLQLEEEGRVVPPVSRYSFVHWLENDHAEAERRADRGAVDARDQRRRDHLYALGMASLDHVSELADAYKAAPSLATFVAAQGAANLAAKVLGATNYDRRNDVSREIAARFNVRSDLPTGRKLLAELEDLQARVLPALGWNASAVLGGNAAAALDAVLAPALFRDIVRFAMLRAHLNTMWDAGVWPITINPSDLGNKDAPRPADVARAWRAQGPGDKPGVPYLKLPYMADEDAKKFLPAVEAWAKGAGVHVARDQAAPSDGRHMLSDAVEAVGARAGMEPRPEIYGDEPPPPVSPLDAVRDAIATLNTYAPTEDEAAAVIEATRRAADLNQIIHAAVPTGKTETRTFGDGSQYTSPVRENILAPASVIARAFLSEGAARRQDHVAAHRERVAELKAALAGVAAKVGDLTTLRAEVQEAAAKALGVGVDVLRTAQADNAAHWSVGWELWKHRHPDEHERQRERYNTDPSRRPPEAELEAIEANRRKVGQEYQRAWAAASLAAVRKRTRHKSDGKIARSRIHQPDPEAEETLKRWAEKAGVEPAGNVRPYDLEADPGDFARVLDWIHPDVAPHVDVAHLPHRARAHCGWNNSIRLSSGDTDGPSDVLWHEYGHAIEHDHPTLTRMANTLRDERGKGQPLRKLSDVDGGGYEKHEVTYEDHWRDKYTGKWYGHQGSTEVTSMGVQHLFTDAVTFAERDPEHFHLVVGALSGMLGAGGTSKHPKGKAAAPDKPKRGKVKP